MSGAAPFSVPHNASLGAEAPGLAGKAIERLEEIVEQETAALRSHAKIDLKDFNNRKSHGLLELSQAMRLLDGVAVDPAILTRLGTLRTRLETNRAVLKMHLDAVREISTIVADAIRDAESDGTYSRVLRGDGKRS